MVQHISKTRVVGEVATGTIKDDHPSKAAKKIPAQLSKSVVECCPDKPVCNVKRH